MPVNNSFKGQQPQQLQQNPAPAPLSVEYKWGDTFLTLDAATVRAYLVNGQGNVTDQEIGMFLNMCKFQRLNPFLREAYLIKYSDKTPAAIVVGKETFQKRAFRNPKFKGFEAGVIIYHEDSGEFERRIGALAIPIQGQQLCGGWAKVYIEGYQVPVEMTITYREYVGRKSDGKLTQQWAVKPATMLRKVALVQALREAFPEDLGGLYDADELDIEEQMHANDDPVEIPEDPEGQQEPNQLPPAEDDDKLDF